jgi:hypothetical protein
VVGTTRSRVSHFMNKFRKLGFISYNGKIEVQRSLMDAVLREVFEKNGPFQKPGEGCRSGQVPKRAG